MVITVLEGTVTEEKASVLKNAYEKAIQNLEPGIVETFLVRDIKKQDLWRIITIWESQEALNTMRDSGKTPTGVLIFRDAGAEPALSILDVVKYIRSKEIVK